MLDRTITRMKDLELETGSGDDGSSVDVDEDICSEEEISRLFPKADRITEQFVSDDKYILEISANRDSSPNIALGLSDCSVAVYSLNDYELAKLATLTEHEDTISGLKFNTDSNLLYTGSRDGSILAWDLRTPKRSSIKFEDSTKEEGQTPKVFNCFDIAPNERLLCAGTDVVGGDAYILFWDIRNTKLLGGYWESHTDDITQVKFHPTDYSRLISGSMDGLINLYDLDQENEDDAILDSLNTESSVESLAWCNLDGGDAISCTTHTADVQIWRLDDAEPYLHFRRADVAKAIKKKSEEFTYVAGTHSTQNNYFILAGSNANEGDCLRAVKLRGQSIAPFSGFQPSRQRVRSSWFNENTNLLLTGGERGILEVWRLDNTADFAGSPSFKRKRK